MLVSGLHLEINCVNIKQRRYNRGPWRPEFIILIIWTGRHVKNPSLLLEHCVRSLDYSTCLFNVFDGNGLPLWACTFSDNHCCEVKQNISGCRAKPGAVPWITVEMLKTPWFRRFLIYGYKIKDPFNSFLMGKRSQILILVFFCCLQDFNVKVFLIVACGQKKELYYELDEILVWTN